MSDPAKWLRELSEPWASGERVKSAIDRAAKLAGLPYWRASDIWYRKARQIEKFEIEKIVNAIEAKNKRDAANALSELRARLSKLEAAFYGGDADFRSPSIDHARDMLRQLGGPYRPMAKRGCA